MPVLHAPEQASIGQSSQESPPAASTSIQQTPGNNTLTASDERINGAEKKNHELLFTGDCRTSSTPLVQQSERRANQTFVP